MSSKGRKLTLQLYVLRSSTQPKAQQRESQNPQGAGGNSSRELSSKPWSIKWKNDKLCCLEIKDTFINDDIRKCIERKPIGFLENIWDTYI